MRRAIAQTVDGCHRMDATRQFGAMDGTVRANPPVMVKPTGSKPLGLTIIGGFVLGQD